MAALDYPNSPTLNQLYAAPNGVTYKWDGTAWIVAAAGPPTELWTDTGTALTPYDATKSVTVPGTAGAGAVIFGNRTIKGRFQQHPTVDVHYFTSNATLNAAGSAWVQDDASKPSWLLNLYPTTGDQFSIARCPPGGAATTLLLLDNAGQLTLPTSGANNPVVFGSRAVKGRLVSFGTNDLAYLTVNAALNAASSAWVQDDGAKASWLVAGDAGTTGAFQIIRFAPGGAATTILQCNSTGDLTISGANAIKASGTTWANPSDPRLKQDVAPYAAGLADICQLEPITYRLKSQPDGPLCYGFDAEKVRAVFPECVSETRMKLSPDDEEETDGVLSFDMHPILVALVTAVKELATKVDALTKGA